MQVVLIKCQYRLLKFCVGLYITTVWLFTTLLWRVCLTTRWIHPRHFPEKQCACTCACAVHIHVLPHKVLWPLLFISLTNITHCSWTSLGSSGTQWKSDSHYSTWRHKRTSVSGSNSTDIWKFSFTYRLFIFNVDSFGCLVVCKLIPIIGSFSATLLTNNSADCDISINTNDGEVLIFRLPYDKVAEKWLSLLKTAMDMHS